MEDFDRLYLTPTHNWPQWDDQVVGRLVDQDREATYGGGGRRDLELGGVRRDPHPVRGLAFPPGHGRPRRRIRPDADVIALPTTDTHRTEVLSMVDAFNDEDDEQFLAEWDAAEQHAVQVLRKALANFLGAPPPEPDLRHAAAAIRDGVRQNGWPHRHIAGAAGWTGSPPRHDQQCCVEAAGALIGMREESGLADEEVATIMALEHADWLGAVIGLVRSGPGAAAGPRDLVRLIHDCPEVDGLVDPDETTILEGAFDSVLYSWEAACVVDDNRQLSVLGSWLLPRALAWAWNADFDDENPF